MESVVVESVVADNVPGRCLQFFTMPGCPACVSVQAALAQLCAERPELSVERIDLAEQPQAAGRYGVMACPAVALDGELIAVGNVDVSHLRNLVPLTGPAASRASRGSIGDGREFTLRRSR